MKNLKKILVGLFFSFIFLFNFEVKAQNLSELISTYKSDLTFAKIQRDEFIADIFTFADIKKSKMINTELWLQDSGKKKDDDQLLNWFDVNSYIISERSCITNKFMPFVEKLIVPADSKIIFFGDLHGDLNSLFSIFEDLKSLGYLDENYKNTNPNNYYVFLGDYVDRGQHDYQVLSLLVKFFNENSNNVFLLRGNHEDAMTHTPDSVLDELRYGFLCSGGQPDLRNSRELFNKIHCLFEYLPVAFYLGCRDSAGFTNFLQCCHGGIEIGYNPSELLSDDSVKYQRILNLDRRQFLEGRGFIDKNINFYIEQSKVNKLQDLGFCWNDFKFDDDYYDDYYFGINLARGAILGSELFWHYLDMASSKEFELCGVIRAHQHNDKVLTNLLNNCGCVALWDGLVYTLLSTNLGMGSDSGWSGSSFNILEMNNNEDDWMMYHYFRLNGAEMLNSEDFLYFSPDADNPVVYREPVADDAIDSVALADIMSGVDDVFSIMDLER